MKIRTRYNLSLEKRYALLMAAPNTRWYLELERDLLSKFKDTLPDYNVSGGFKHWIQTGDLIDAKTIAQILCACERQCMSIKCLLLECMMELPDELFGAVLYLKGNNGYGVRGKIACIKLLPYSRIEILYEEALSSAANLIVEKSIDPLSNMVVPLEGILFTAYDLERAKQQASTIKELANAIGCTMATVEHHAKLLSLYGNLVKEERIGENGSDIALAITDEGKGLVDRMRASGRCWFYPGLVLARSIAKSFEGDLTDLAQAAGIPIQNLCGILDGCYEIGAFEANSFATVLDRPAQFWLSLQELQSI